MKIEIDQSGKVEQTSKDTILCLATNEKWFTVKISAKVKRKMKLYFREKKQIRNFILFTFSAALAQLIIKVGLSSRITIDIEYEGKNHIIKNIITEMLEGEEIKPVIEFRRVGKTSKADYWAGEVAKGKRKSTWTLTEEDIFEQIKKTEVGKRLSDA